MGRHRRSAARRSMSADRKLPMARASRAVRRARLGGGRDLHPERQRRLRGRRQGRARSSRRWRRRSRRIRLRRRRRSSAPRPQWARLRRTANPFPEAARDEPNRLHARSFPSARPQADAAEALQARAGGGERVAAAGGALWIHYPARRRAHRRSTPGADRQGRPDRPSTAPQLAHGRQAPGDARTA